MPKTVNWLTVDQVAAALQSHPEVVRRWLRTGRLRGYKWGRAWRVPEEAIPKPLESRSPVEGPVPLNVVDGCVQSVQRDSHLAWVQTDGRLLAVMLAEFEAGAQVRVFIPGDALLVSRRKLSGISARNQWPGLVDSLLVRPEGVEVRVATEPRLTAWMSAEAVQELELRPGKRVVLIFKASACRTVVLQASSAMRSGPA